MFGRRVTLIDTPGFDDTTKSDTEILKMIASYLADAYRVNKKLSGVIYMHRISDFKMGGISKRNFGMFRSLCGEKTLQNVVIVTNMWGEVSEERGVARENELANDNALFKPVLEKGAQMVRHYNTHQSGQEILRRLVDNNPLPLQIQHEIVDEHKQVQQTVAGAELESKAIEEAKRQQEEEMRKHREAMEAAIRAQEEQRAREVEQARREQEVAEARAREEHERQSARQAEERRQEEERMQQIQRALEAEAAARRAEEERIQRIREDENRRAREAEEERERHRREVERLRNERNDDCVIF
ncbi:hypothetical protein PHLCEN_2v1369 [Hermanssonia centrifuga]|uniref:G domain-containing protein n=1 Tax=Hermanssonia centrifuga TaxID=98765 RepID=A0A2R6S3J3_9APHY|nr:hypothetical protein PHLCEN_2v1369 [Hermanssonia centrifuga]